MRHKPSAWQAHHHSENDDVAPFPSLLFGITLALTLATFALVFWAAYGKYRAAESFRNRESRIQALHGIILRLDEVLTMSARMAAATGDLRWEQRYRRYAPELDAAIAEAKALVPGGSSSDDIRGTDAANVKLVAMEDRAFALVRAGQLNEARSVLSSPAYETQKVLYSSGLDNVLKEQRKRLDGILAQARQRAALSLAASVTLLLFSVATWIVIIGRLRGMQRQLEHRITKRTAELSAANVELLAARDTAVKEAVINAQQARESALILNSATDGILGMDFVGEPSYLNPAGARMLGRSLGDLKGKPIHDLIHHSHADGTPWPEADCPFAQALRRGEMIAVANDTFWRPDGSSFPVEYSGTPMLNEDGKIRGAVMMFRDVTERRAIERLKDEFVSTVSHELRTPLTSIRGALGLLSSGLLGPIAEKGQRMLEIAVSNTDRLVRLINDILDLERIESGVVELSRGSVEASAVMVQASEGVQSMADQAGVRIAVMTATATLFADSDRIIQTLTNLLGNAIKFSPPGTTVTLSGAARVTDFVFCVADQGRGVPVQRLDTIFERFSQLDASDSRDKGGSGLGLAICRSIVHAHGGRIWAEKNDPAGSRFQFTIPLAVPSTVAHDLASDAPSVLVVENDLDLARVMITALQSHGIRIVQAVTGSDAVRLCRQHEPSLIVLDPLLPDMDGFAVVSALRESATLRRIPLLVYTALDVSIADQSRLRLGPTEFLTKSRGTLGDFEAHVVRLLETVTNRKMEGLSAA